MSPAFRSGPSSGIMRAQTYGIGSTPMEKLAIRAIEANNRARDMSMKSSTDKEAESSSATPAATPAGYEDSFSDQTFRKEFPTMAELEQERMGSVATKVWLKAEDM